MRSYKPLYRVTFSLRSNYCELAKTSHFAIIRLSHLKSGLRYALKANGYLTSMTQFSSLFGLKMSYLIFSATEKLSLTIQGKDTTIQEGVQAASLTMNFYKSEVLMISVMLITLKFWLTARI